MAKKQSKEQFEDVELTKEEVLEAQTIGEASPEEEVFDEVYEEEGIERSIDPEEELKQVKEFNASSNLIKVKLEEVKNEDGSVTEVVVRPTQEDIEGILKAKEDYIKKYDLTKGITIKNKKGWEVAEYMYQFMINLVNWNISNWFNYDKVVTFFDNKRVELRNAKGEASELVIPHEHIEILKAFMKNHSGDYNDLTWFKGNFKKYCSAIFIVDYFIQVYELHLRNLSTYESAQAMFANNLTPTDILIEPPHDEELEEFDSKTEEYFSQIELYLAEK